MASSLTLPEVALANEVSKRTHQHSFPLLSSVFFFFGTKKRSQIARHLVKVESEADLDQIRRAIGIMEFLQK
jgi:hypothetical protein